MSAYGGKEMAAAFRTVRTNTLQVAQDIPEDKYDFVAAPELRSVRALLAHIAIYPRLADDMHRVKHISTVQGYDFFGMMKQMGAEEATPRTKAQLIELLTSEGEKFAKWLESLSPAFLAETYTDHTGANPKSRFEGLLSPKEHEMHHRAQLMLIQRLLGITPHLTRRRQEQAAAMAKAAEPAAAGAR